MDPIIGGALISAGSNLIGGLLGGSNNHAGRDQRQATSFANRSAILDKVAAAKEAGISPLYALGAPTISASSAVGDPGNNGLGQALAAMGQDVGRAVAAKQTAAERAIQALTLEKAGLENEYLRAQIHSINGRTARESAPAIPTPNIPGEKVQPNQRATGITMGGRRLVNDPNFSDAQTFENIFGDSEVGQMMYGLAKAWSMFNYNFPPYHSAPPPPHSKMGRYGYYR